MLFQKVQNTLREINHIDFKLEKDIQKLLENNLELAFGLQFLETEFPLKDMRFDTVAYDEENAAFVIIEYKKVRNTSLVDQGYAYLHTVLDRKAELVLLYNKVRNDRKQVSDFSWDMTRIYFVSPYFSKFQLAATGFANMPFKLFGIQQYDGGLIEITEIENKTETEFEPSIQDKVIESVNKEIKVWTFDDYCKKTNPCNDVLELYSQLVDSVSDIASFSIDYKKVYIAFKAKHTNVFDCAFTKKKLKIWLNLRWNELGEIPSELPVIDVSNIGHHGNGDYQFDISTEAEIEMLIPLIRKTYEKKTGRS